MGIYVGVGHLWLVGPLTRTLEAYRLGEGGAWMEPEEP
jgi:hypothetical protein